MTDVHSELMGLLQRAPYIGCADTDRQYAVNWLMNNGVTVQKWIPVTERLPEKFGEYIVAIKTISGVVYSDYADYDPFQQRWTTGLFFDIGSKVTHWMPLPEPPKDIQVKQQNHIKEQ